MISTHDKMTAAEILSADCRKKRFPRPHIARIGLKSGKNNLVLRIKLFHHKFIAFDYVVRIEIARFLLANNRMNK